MDGKIEFMEEISVSESSRKRWKKIVGHLPLGTAFTFCDIDVTPLVSEGTRKGFADELGWRKAKWEKKKKERGTSSVQRKQQQQQQPQQPQQASAEPTTSSAWEVDYSAMPEEVRIALQEADKEEAQRVLRDQGEKGEGGVVVGGDAPGSAKKSTQSQQQKGKGSAPVQTNLNTQKPDATDGDGGVSTSPSMPSFSQVVKNTAPVPMQKKEQENGSEKGGKGKKQKAQSLFSNNSSRRY